MKIKNQYVVTNCMEKYSMEQGTWRTTAPLPVPLACHAVVTMKNKLYVLGGWTPQVEKSASHVSGKCLLLTLCNFMVLLAWENKLLTLFDIFSRKTKQGKKE